MAERKQGWVSGMMSSFLGQRPPKVSPFKEAGTSGTAVFGGYVEINEKNPKLSFSQRYITAADILANVAIVGAGMRFFLNLTAKPTWKVKPAEDNGPDEEPSDDAKLAAEFVESVLDGMSTNWSRIVRRSAMYRFHGFGIQEWTAKKRDDGMIGLLDIEPRPQHTIEKWEVDISGQVLGVWQRSPQTQELIWLPRDKILYLVDDTLTDSPEGMGLFRHLVEPAERYRAYLKLEGMGFQRDLRGLPIGRAPLADINDAVEKGVIKEADGRALIAGLKKFVKLQAKDEDTGIILDSKPYEGRTADGTTVSGSMKWGLDLISTQGGAFADLAKAIERLRFDMAMILGTESLLLGSTGSGSRALSEDKSRNLYLQTNSTLSDMAEAMTRDVIDPLWTLNGLPDELKPKLVPEEVQFRDADTVAQVLRDMATAGATLEIDDPVIDDVRDMLGVSRQPEITQERIDMLAPPPPVGVDPVTGEPLPPPAPGQPGKKPPPQIAGPKGAEPPPPKPKEK